MHRLRRIEQVTAVGVHLIIPFLFVFTMKSVSGHKLLNLFFSVSSGCSGAAAAARDSDLLCIVPPLRRTAIRRCAIQAARCWCLEYS